MRKWLQRIRGALGMGLTWAMGWAPIGAVVGAVLHVVVPGSLSLGSVVVLNATTFAALGLIGGTIFAGVLRVTEGRRRFDELSLPRFAGWGALGGVLLGGAAVAAGLWGGGFGLLGASMLGAATLLGAVSAASSLALARRADDQELVQAGTDTGARRLPETERHPVLGRGD